MAKIRLMGNFSQIIEETDFEFLSVLDDHLSFVVPGAQYTKAFRGFQDRSGKFQRWDGTRKIMTSTLVFPSGLVPRIQTFYRDHHKELTVVDERPPVTQSVPINIDAKLKQLGKEPYPYQVEAVEEAKKHERGILKMATGSGKCVRYDSLTLTDQGMLDFHELLNGSKLPSGDSLKLKVKVAAPFNNKFDYSSNIYHDGFSATRRIVNDCGFELTATPIHRIKIITDEGLIAWKYVKDLKIGDYTVIAPGTNLFGNCEINMDDAYWYGLLLGDGGLSRKNTVTLTNMDEHILSFSRKYLNDRNIKYYESKKKKNGHIVINKASDIVICNKDYRSKLYNIGFDYCLSINKELPQFIRRLSKKSLAMVIRGLYETDGWVEDKPAICIGLSSKKIIDQLQLALLNFGIVSHRRVKKTLCQDSHILTIYKDYIDVFNNEIGFDPNGHKYCKLQNFLQKHINDVSNTNVCVIPNQAMLINELIKPLVWKHGSFKDCPIKRRTIQSWVRVNFRRNPSKTNYSTFLKWIATKYNKNDIVQHKICAALKLCKPDLFFSPIKTIEETISDNYDFVVPESHSFVSQGFINHNTMIAAMLTANYGKKTIVYVIGKDLLYQFHSLFSDIFGPDVGIIGDGQCRIGNITIASIWTVGKALGMKNADILLDSDDGEKEVKGRDEDIKRLISESRVNFFDECHVAACETIQSIYKTMESAEHIYGLSGSPWRDDNADLLIEGILGSYIVDIPASYLIERGYLAKPIIKFVAVPALDEQPPNNYQSTYKAYIVENQKRNDLIVKAAKAIVAQGYQTLVLFNSLAHGEILYNLIKKEIPCEILNGSDDQKTRERVKERLTSGDLKCVLASRIFEIGVDLPSLSGLVIAGGGKSSVKSIQRIGRVIRKYPGKKIAAIVDFIDNAKFLDKHSKLRYKIYTSEEGFEVIWPKQKRKKGRK